MSDQSDTDITGDGDSDSTDGDGTDGGGPGLPSSGTLPLRRVFDVLLVLALVLVVVPFVVYASPSLVGAEDSYVVRSGSMEPAIGTGDVVIVERAAPAAIETGDVITFVPDGQPPPTTHRVVSKTEQDGVIRFETKGDANEQPDAEPVVENELVGRVTLVIPYVGYVIQFASTSMGFFALVAAPFGLLLATEVWSLFREGGDESGSTTDTSPSDTPTAAPDTTAGSDDVFTLTPTDVRLSLAALLVFTCYSSLVAVANPTPWSIAVAVGAFGTTVYLAAMRYTAVTAGGPTTGPAAGGDPFGPPPAREVAPLVEGAGAHPHATGEGPESNGRLPASLVEPPTASIRPGETRNGHRQADENGTGASGGSIDASEDLTTVPADRESSSEQTGAAADEASDEEPADQEPADEEVDGTVEDDTADVANTEDDGRGLLGVLALPFLVVGRGCYRVLYLVGWAEVTAVNRLRQLARPTRSGDGGEG